MDTPSSRTVSLGAQTIQRNSRLLLLLALGLLTTSCATALRDYNEIKEAPKNFDEEIQEVDVEKIVEKAAVKKADPAKTQKKPAPVDEKSNFLQKKPVPEPKAKTQKVSQLPKKEKTKKEAKGLWQPKVWPYGIGEESIYALRYGLIEGGEIHMKVLTPKVLKGEQVLHYFGRVKSTRMLDWFYKVDDTIESWVGLKDHLPRRQVIEQRESAQWGRRVVLFDPKKKKTQFYSNTTKKDGTFKELKLKGDIENNAQDIFASMYFFRFLEPQDRIAFGINDRAKNWVNEVIYSKQETIDLPAGTFKARRYTMKPRLVGHLKPKGEVEAWYSDDERRILLRFKAKLKFGSITGDLRSYKKGRALKVPTPKMKTPFNLSKKGRVVSGP